MWLLVLSLITAADIHQPRHISGCPLLSIVVEASAVCVCVEGQESRDSFLHYQHGMVGTTPWLPPLSLSEYLND